MIESLNTVNGSTSERDIVSKIADGHYGLWTVIAKKSMEKEQEQVFLSLLTDFILSNKEIADESFGKELIQEVLDLGKKA
jgi:hypothetical protein